ncbi:FAD linked oxidase domain protein [Methylobacterium sp. 4-46]|uniref:D-2-hydroxyglutarate dehydrogenase YdiJ n=1 Tax=unclassified Methylobacterium TaxID=2615210 RepID=UPI000165CB6D|nr:MULTISPECIES: FAD-binding and (Fe-S)-binding domain-containing protein [Methylobacterium]ACA19920.1 FAD linked oxidase domain protein [Methylobacterium sp. 4-46]WFT79106.1 FAD-binding and (Fe-S)-binding domain-containing protein [Methylobacterium nodulans]
MIPRLPPDPVALPLYPAFCAELRARGFSGDLSLGAADRTVLATDNSIYQLTPQAIAFPSGLDDLVRIATLLAEERFSGIRIAPRGGGTGTNGQSLTDGLVVDLSRHMNRILAIDPAQRTARVEAGVVKDQLNAALKAHGLFFAPELSTSNRATIGGMISTDACGQGSCLYGKTRDHVLELTSVLSDGTVWHSQPLDDDELMAVQARPDRAGHIHREVDRLQRENAALIAERFPPLNRCLTGYDLAHIRRPDGRFDLNALLCGAEGTLGFLAEATLNVLPLPSHAALVNVRYASFDAALRDAQALVPFGAASIETVDSTVLALAQGDPVWESVAAFFPEDDGERARGVNLIEFVGDGEDAVEAAVGRLTAALDAGGAAGGRRGYTVARGETHVSRIWNMRKKAVGLLGNMKGDRRPIAFVEDSAVPPENLADYIAEFRTALDRRGLDYGMFGHVDAGVLHVRPAIDMKAPGAEALIREVTEEVVALTQAYGGLLWGEHGKGVRSEFSPRFFGPLYPVLQAVKAAFDPGNQFNPGKIAVPAGEALLTVDGVPTKGGHDRAISPEVRAAYDGALHCNGNGACFTWDPDEAMCPSWKGTRERRHSPKGRAQLMREWLRRLAAAGSDPLAEAAALRARPAWRAFPARLAATLRRGDDVSHAVHEAMAGCLACKSCTGLCPIKVDVPSFRARFLELYHGRYLRPLRHHAVASLEAIVPWLAKAPRLANLATKLAGAIGLVHAPKLSGLDLKREIARRGVALADADVLAALPAPERLTSVVVVQDAFTSYYDTPVLLALLDLLIGLGLRPWLAPYRPNGKPLHVHGFLGRFERLAERNAADLGRLASTGVALVGLDPSMTLTYRSDYAQALPGRDLPRVHLVQEWLAARLDRASRAPEAETYWLLPHCTERATAQPAVAAWSRVFAAFGLTLEVLPSGCCGMAGTYGHEAEHRALSERIYALSWAAPVAEKGRSGRLVADGYSCRSQAKLIDGVRLPHPVEILRDHVAKASVLRGTAPIAHATRSSS